MLTTWTSNFTPIALAHLGDQLRHLHGERRLRARVEVELERLPVLRRARRRRPAPSRRRRAAGFALSGSNGVVSARALVEGLVEGRQQAVGDEATSRAWRSPAACRGRCAKAIAWRTVVSCTAGLNFASGQCSGARVERQLGVGRRSARGACRRSAARRAARSRRRRPRGRSRPRPSVSARSVASWLPYLMNWISSHGPALAAEVRVAPHADDAAAVVLGRDVRAGADQRQLRLVGAGQLLERHLAPDVLGQDVDEQAADEARVRASWRAGRRSRRPASRST